MNVYNLCRPACSVIRIISNTVHLMPLNNIFQAVMIDMEDSVVNSILQGPLGDVFENRQLITNVYGSGNNW